MASLQKPRKSPSQKRSEVTLAAIHQATIQVLLTEGVQRTTTTRIAERAGVSVGSLYQYYPNKQSLYLALCAQQLQLIEQTVQSACRKADGRTLDSIVRTVVEAFVSIKLENIDLSKVLYRLHLDDQPQLVQATLTACVDRFIETLSSCSDRTFTPPIEQAAFFAMSAMSGTMQHLLSEENLEITAELMEKQMRQLVKGYLLTISSRRKALA